MLHENLINFCNHVLQDFLRNIMTIYVNNDCSILENYKIRVDSAVTKNDNTIVFLQIPHSRATFSCEIRKISTNPNILFHIEPVHLIELGYLHKCIELQHKPSECMSITKVHRGSLIENILNVLPSQHCLSEKIFPLRIIEENYYDDLFYIKLNPHQTALSFDIPINELNNDFSLLTNIAPCDLVRAGYMTKEQEIKCGHLLLNRRL